MTIPNRISLLLIAGFLIAAPLTGMQWEVFLMHLATGVVVLLLGIALFAFRLLGGGDAKLLAAASLWIGWAHLGLYMGMVVILGGVLAAMLLIYRGMPMPVCLWGQPWALRLHSSKEGIPYGLALTGAALWVFPLTTWFSLAAV